jgi:dipeptidyl-peptidase 4
VNRFFLILSILSLFATSLAQSAAPSSQHEDLTIPEIFAQGSIAGQAPESVQWSPDGSKLSFLLRDDSGEHGQLWYVDAATGQKKVLVSEMKLSSLAPPISGIKNEREKEWITRYHVAAYHWAPDSQHLLFDALGQLWLYNLQQGIAVAITSSPAPSQDPKFSPDGTHLAYVRQHNLYVRSVSQDEEKQLTKDKDPNILNGEVDWVYAEELNVRSNYFWSPNSKDILFLQTNETPVPDYPIPNLLTTHASVYQEKYPQAGDPNPVVRLGVINSNGGNPKWFKLGGDPDTYIPRFGWVRDGLFWAEVLNRTQTEMDLYFVDVHAGKERKVLTESDPTGWINVNDDFRAMDSRGEFLWSSWRDGTTQLYLYSYDKDNPLGSDAQLQRQLTKGDFEVLGVQGLDEKDGIVYFTCNANDPRQTQLYAVNLDGSGFHRVSQEDGTHQPNFAGNAQHYADTFSSLITPPQLSVCNANGTCHQVWSSHGVEKYDLRPPQFLQFKAGDGTTLYGELLLPSTRPASGKIPLIVYIYGGPAGQTVRDQWIGEIGLFHQILARDGFAVFSVDNRGTPNRDRKFQTAIRHEFGKIELSDQIASLHQLFDRFPQLDRNRVGIWGWSNGGSMTLYSLEHSDLFKAGVSVAPVTDWRLYDSIYTERYMGLPKDDFQAYADSSMVDHAADLHGHLLLVHGTGDDNVHFQNSIQMVNALVAAGKQFRFMVYPGKTHGISGQTDRDHLFDLIQHQFEQELK